MPDSVESFLSQIVAVMPAFAKAEQQLDREIGRRFSATALFYPDENTSSRILADLLNHNGSHGQGNAFLKLFIQKFIPEWEKDFPNGRVNCEYPTDNNRRIDVHIRAGRFHLAIENKFRGAGDQEKQVPDYHAYMTKSAAKNDEFRLIYLSQSGARPEDGCPENNFILASWVPSTRTERPKSNGSNEKENKIPLPNILEWLDLCREKCAAENVRWFLKDFANYIRHELTGGREMDTVKTEIVDLVLQKPENLEATLRIVSSGETIINKVIWDFLEAIRSNQKNPDRWELTEPLHDFPLRDVNWPKCVCIGWDGGGIGIKSPTQEMWNPKWEDNSKKDFLSSKQYIELYAMKLSSDDTWPIRHSKSFFPIWVPVHKGNIEHLMGIYHATQDIKNGKHHPLVDAIQVMISKVDEVINASR